VTFNVSPFATIRLPPVKLPAEYKTPDVPLVAVHINAPATVPEALMVNEVAVEALEPAEADPQAGALRSRIACIFCPAAMGR